MIEYLRIPVSDVTVGMVLHIPIFGKDFPVKVTKIVPGNVTTLFEVITTFNLTVVPTFHNADTVRRPFTRSNVLRKR